MDAVVKNFPKTTAPAEKPRCRITSAPRPSRPFRAPRARRRKPRCARLLSYIGDNPDREGLVETPKRFVNAYEELFARLQGMPGRGARPHVLGDRRLRRSGAGARHPVLFALRASRDAVHRQGAYRLCADRARGRPVQDRAADRRLCAAPADAGAPDLADRDRDRRDPQAARRRRDARGRAHLHVDARRREARLDDAHDASSPACSTIRRSRCASSRWCAAARADRRSRGEAGGDDLHILRARLDPRRSRRAARSRPNSTPTGW